MSDLANFAFLLVSYRNDADTQRCVASIIAQSQRKNSPKILILIYDNSPSQTLGADCFKKYGSQVKVMGDGTNIGFAKACNVLARAASSRAKVLIFLNNDTVLGPNFLNNLSKLKDLASTAYNPVIFNRDQTVWFSGGVFNSVLCRPNTKTLPLSQKLASDFLTGCCLIVSSDNWHMLGGFDERYFLYYEDVDWSLRASKHIKLYVEPTLSITHFTHSTTGSVNGPLQTYFQIRNNLLLSSKLQKIPLVPYLYVVVISLKRTYNLFLLKKSRKKDLSVRNSLGAIILAWKDFLLHNYEKGSFKIN